MGGFVRVPRVRALDGRRTGLNWSGGTSTASLPGGWSRTTAGPPGSTPTGWEARGISIPSLLKTAINDAIADVRAGKGGPVPVHLRGSGYAGAAHLGHGKGYVYAHDEADAVAAQQYLPDDLHGSTDYYRPTDRGFEGRLQERWTWLKSRLGRG